MLLVATDFSEQADTALAFVGQLAPLLGAPVELLHVLAPDAPPSDDRGHPEILTAALDRELVLRADQLRAEGIACTARLLQGIAHQEIVRRASEARARLIVMGTHGGTGPRRVFLGSVAERVIQNAPCPVTVVPR